MNLQRVYKLNTKDDYFSKPVAYWMSRDQRIEHNWAFIYAYEKAQKENVPLYVFFALTPTFLGATLRQYDFMIKGLQEVEIKCKELEVGFELILETPEKGIPYVVKKYDIGTLVTDFSPLKIGRHWRTSVAKDIRCSMYEVDAHNIVPCRIVSQKQEYAARTIRPKIYALLPIFLDQFPNLHKMQHPVKNKLINWTELYNRLDVDTKVKPVDWLIPGSTAARSILKDFIENKLTNYDLYRNDASKDGQSNLSPYLHFGQISAQFVAQEVIRAKLTQQAKDPFLEELIIRRELADNFCYYNQNYDSFEGFPEWAQKTLTKHKNDKRLKVYTQDQFEYAQTEDSVWNFAQRELVATGKMHGYLRMYWAKKILEWSNTPQDALNIAIYLNDKYELDGRDPNGYVGVAWSIGGVHDRPWFERDIYGLIRYMSSTKIQKMLQL